MNHRYRIVLFIGIVIATLSSIGLTNADDGVTKMKPMGVSNSNADVVTDTASGSSSSSGPAKKYSARVEFCTS